MNFGPVHYWSNDVPAAYRCTTCGRHGCKLWREYQTMADHTELVCADCAGTSQKHDVSAIDSRGRTPSCAGLSSSIGWRVPAVPTEEGDTFWGYTSTPVEAWMWWHALPSRIPAPEKP